MHKGYAFVQFTNPFDARSACLGEDGRTVLGQTLGEWPTCSIVAIVRPSFRQRASKFVTHFMRCFVLVIMNQEWCLLGCYAVWLW
jgi:hypothetical protein